MSIRWYMSCIGLVLVFFFFLSALIVANKGIQIIDTIRIVCDRVYVSMVTVRLSVRLSILSTAATACSGFTAAGPAARKYWSTAARSALSSNWELCHTVSWCKNLNTDLLIPWFRTPYQVSLISNIFLLIMTSILLMSLISILLSKYLLNK